MDELHSQPRMATSPTEPTSGRSGSRFKAVLSKARPRGNDSSSTPSVYGTDNSSESHGVRSSIDSTRDKPRLSGESSADNETVSKSRKLSKLVSNRLKKKKTKKQKDDKVGEDQQVEDGGIDALLAQRTGSISSSSRSHDTNLAGTMTASSTVVESPSQTTPVANRKRNSVSSDLGNNS